MYPFFLSFPRDLKNHKESEMSSPTRQNSLKLTIGERFIVEKLITTFSNFFRTIILEFVPGHFPDEIDFQ